MPAEDYQFGFSAMHHLAMHDVGPRRRKAETMRLVLEDCMGDLGEMRILDLGASTGIIGNHLAAHCGTIIGIDIDLPAVAYATKHRDRNADFLVADGMQMPFANDTFDVVICAQIYEHVPDAERLLADIHRVLKPGGVCYFAAGNRLMFMEPHYRLPFLSVLPKPLADVYMRLARRGKRYYETHRTYWGLRRLVKAFDTVDYTRRLIESPESFGCEYMLAPESLKQRLALALARTAYWLVPGYIWLLRKPLQRT